MASRIIVRGSSLQDENITLYMNRRAKCQIEQSFGVLFSFGNIKACVCANAINNQVMGCMRIFTLEWNWIEITISSSIYTPYIKHIPYGYHIISLTQQFKKLTPTKNKGLYYSSKSTNISYHHIRYYKN